MQKKTKDLFLKLKGLNPSVHGISHDYGTDWKVDRVVEIWYLHIPNKFIPFKTEKELVDEIERIINTTENDLGLRYPNTVKLMKNEMKKNT